MQEFENNAYFWQKVDTLYLSGDFELAFKKGDKHPIARGLVYPCDYGYIKTFSGDDENTIAVYRGTLNKKIQAVAVCADILEKSLEVKIMVGLTPEEEDALLRFMNKTEIMKTVIVRRGKNVPLWAETEQ